MKLTGCLLTFLVTFIIAIVVAVGNLLRVVFNIKRKFEHNQEGFSNKEHTHRESYSKSQSTSSTSSSTNKDKLFGENEGEYVDYEEIK